MIISHKYKFIFVAIPKVAGHSIRRSLRPFMGKSDLEQVGLFEKKKFPYKDLADIDYGHISCKQIKPVLEPGVWGDYYKFTFVRNPWDRYISSCFFKYASSYKFKLQPEKYLRQIIEKEKYKEKIHFDDQSDFICDENDRLMVDFVGRYERINQDFQTICDEVGINIDPRSHVLQWVNNSQHLKYTEYYDQKLIDMVGELYQRDVRNFEYCYE
jgi:hypothetical protein